MNPNDPGGQLPPPSPTPQPQQPYGPPQAPQLPQPTLGPEQSYGPPPNQALPHHHKQFEFIMNPGAPTKSSGLGGLFSKRTLLILGGLIVLVVIIIVAASSLLGSKNDMTAITVTAEDQTELIRVAKLGTVSATESTAQNVAYNVSLALTTAQQQTAAYLATNHTKLGIKQLSLKQDGATTTDLKNAVATSTFDNDFLIHIQSLLSTYSQDLKSAYNANPGPNGRKLLSNQYNAAQLLLAQSKQQAP